MQTRLMIEVERAVRPVRAPVSTKMRMREELLAHLMDIHADEASGGGDTEAVLRRTLARFGTPEMLTEELQRSLNWQERYEAWLNHWLERRDGERPVQIARRLALIMFLMTNGLFAIVFVLQWFVGHSSPMGGLWTVPLGLATMLSLDSFVIGWLGVATADGVRPPAKAALRQPRVWGAALLGGAFVYLAGTALVLAVSKGTWFSGVANLQWSGLALATVIGFVSVLELFQRESVKVVEWDRLVLSLDSASHS